MPEKNKPAPTKREKFEKAGRFPVMKVSIAGAVVALIIVGAVVGYLLATKQPEVGGAVVQTGGADYGSGKVDMTVLPSNVSGGSLKISVADIKANKIVGVLYNRTKAMPDGYNNIEGNGLPVLAYVAPSGKLVVATSLCEPCRSWDFHIEGNDLVCNACFTHWDLNTLQGKKGGCTTYPPKVITTAVQGDTIDVPTSTLESWEPRI
jgi:uncharacterized protein